MPIDPSVNLDANTRRYSLPTDTCVGDAGPSPTQVTTISKSGGRKPSGGGYPGSGGNPYAGGKSTTPGWKNPTTGYDGP